MTKVCIRCQIAKPEGEFALGRTVKSIRQDVCKECNKVLGRYVKNKLKEPFRITCKYTEMYCIMSYANHLCCHECPRRPWCEMACLNRPGPKGCGCK